VASDDNIDTLREILNSWENISLRDKLISKWINPDLKILEQLEQQKADNLKNTWAQTESQDKNTSFSLGNFDITTWKTTFEINWKTINTTLNNDEKNLVRNNPEALWNIINFYKTLDELWIEKLWKWRKEIFIWVSNVKWIAFNSKDWDYLNPNEAKIFLNSVLKSIWKKEIDKSSFNEFKEEFKNRNNMNVNWTFKEEWTVNIRTDIESIFYEEFIPEWTSRFDLMKFKKLLKWASEE
jgi:hypothetical protein